MRNLEDFKTLADATRYVEQEKGLSHDEAREYIRSHLPHESYYQTKILQWLNKQPGVFAWKAAAGPYSRQGIPDICCVRYGRYYGFEVKRPLIGKPSKLQLKTIDQIRAAGGVAEIVTCQREVEVVFLREDER